MKRFLCPQHSFRLKEGARSVLLSTKECSVCKWQNRPWTLKDVAVEFRILADSMEICFDDPYYDPFGVTFIQHFEEITIGFLKSIHQGYKDNMLKNINEALSKDKV